MRTGVGLKYKLGYDDSLDVVGVHLVGGIVGTLMIGLVAAPEAGQALPVCSTAADSTSCGVRPSVLGRFCSTARSGRLSWL